MKKLEILFFLMICVVACGGQETMEVEVTEVVLVATETEMPALTPTAEVVETEMPILTPTAEVVETEMPALLCDPTLLQNAIANLQTFSTYQTDMELLGTDIETEEITFSTHLNMVFQLKSSEIQEMALSMTAGLGENETTMQLIVLENEFHFKQSEEKDWLLITSGSAELMLDQLSYLELLKPELIDSLASADCIAEIENGIIKHKYSRLDIADFMPQFPELGEGVVTVEYFFTELDSIIYPSEALLFAETDSDNMKLFQNISKVNEPVVIEIPNNVVYSSFFYTLPTPPESRVLRGSDEFLVLAATIPMAEAEVFYDDYLLDNGWVEYETRTEIVNTNVIKLNIYRNVDTNINKELGIGVEERTGSPPWAHMTITYTDIP